MPRPKGRGKSKMVERSAKIKRDRLLEALKKNGGFVTFAVKTAGVSLTFYYEQYEKNQEFKAAVDEIAETWVDIAENNVIKNLQEGNVATSMWFLVRKGRHRGYGERIDVSQSQVVFKEERTYEVNNPPDPSIGLLGGPGNE